MKWLGVLLSALLCVLASRGARGAEPNVRRFALVIGNNRPETRDTEVLRYADDDAVATQLLLVDAKVESLLFANLDESTRALHPHVSVAGPPRLSDVERGFATLVERMKAAARLGKPTEFLLFYSGHGDVEGGEGYVVLEGQRLTRTLLFSLLSRSPATHNHVFVDACKSYFLVFDRGPGGRRAPYAGNWAESVPAQLESTGFVLSTSSNRDSHEWERYQGGILSHQLRSGLRGAADADLDGNITYAELGAFFTTANQAIPNARFRPDFMVRAPGHDLGQNILGYSAEQATLQISPRNWGHFYVENAQGERLLDAHPGARQPLRLFLPSDRPLFVRQNDERAEYVLTRPEPVALAELSPTLPELARRGALNLALDRIFAVPFAQSDVLAFRETTLVVHDEPEVRPSSTRRTVRLVAGVGAATAGAAGLTLSALSLQTYLSSQGASQRGIASGNERVGRLNRASLACYGVAVAAGLTWLVATWLPESGVTFSARASGAGVGEGTTLELSREF